MNNARARFLPRRADAGSALVVVLLVMMGLLGMGIVALWLTGGNLQVGANVNQRQQALYLAEAGVERARQVLNALPLGTVSSSILTSSGHTKDEVPRGLDSAGYPIGLGAILRDSGAALDRIRYPPASFARPAGTIDDPRTTTVGEYTVWIRNDTAECRQGQYTLDTNGTVVVSSLGQTPDGTRVLLEVTLGANLGSPPSPGMPLARPPEDCPAGKLGCAPNDGVKDGVVAF